MEWLWRAWDTLCELAPWFLLGAALAGLVHGLAPKAFIKRRLQGYGGVVWASLFGVPLPLCSCAVIPTGIGLRKSGASEGASIGFLVSTPQTGIDSVLVTAAFLGWPLAVFKWVVALVLGVVAGVCTEWWERRRTRHEAEALARAPVAANPVGGPGKTMSLPVLQPSTLAAVDAPRSEATKSGGGGAHDQAVPAASSSMQASGLRGMGHYLWASGRHAVEIIRSIYLWVLFGVLLSAALTVWLPVGAVQQWLGEGGQWLQGPVALLISIPLYVCATASVPVAAALVHGGLSVGATLIFLMAGPATNLATIGAIYRSFSRAAFVTYLVTIVLGSLLAALLFDALVAGGLELAGTVAQQHGHANGHDHAHDHGGGHHVIGWVSQTSAAVLLLMFAWFAWQSAQKRRAHQTAECCH